MFHLACYTKNYQYEGWSETVWNENGLIENLQVLILFFVITILINFYLKLKYLKENSNLRYFIIVEIICLSYFLLEEISWGQQIINFKTFDLFLDADSFLYNKQGETNLHNISNLFNECKISSFNLVYIANYINKKIKI